MTIEDFKTYVKTRKPLDTEEIHRFMDEMSNEARRVTFHLNAAYHTPDEVRGLLSELFGYEVPQSLRVFPPLYADFGKNITVGENVFINACCHFQDHGGVMIGDGCHAQPRSCTKRTKVHLSCTYRIRQECVGRLECYHSARCYHRRQCRHCGRRGRYERRSGRYGRGRRPGTVHQEY